MTHPLSLIQFGQVAVAMLETDPRATVRSVADQVGISEETVYRYWREAHGDRPPRGKALRFETLCDDVYKRLIEPSTFSELRGWFPRLNERTLHRALARLIQDGRVKRLGKAGGGAPYARRAP